VSRTMLVAALYNALEDWYRVFRNGEWSRILDCGRQWSAVLGQPVEVQSGDQRWWGLAWDLDRDGSLLVRDEQDPCGGLLPVMCPSARRPGGWYSPQSSREGFVNSAD